MVEAPSPPVYIVTSEVDRLCLSSKVVISTKDFDEAKGAMNEAQPLPNGLLRMAKRSRVLDAKTGKYVNETDTLFVRYFGAENLAPKS